MERPKGTKSCTIEEAETQASSSLREATSPEEAQPV